MSRTRIWIATALLLGTSLAGTTAIAQMGQDEEVVNGFYLGGAITQARFDDDNFSLSDVDDEDNSWKIVGGYRFLDNFAVEASYVDFGEMSAPLLTGTGVPFSAEAKGFTAFGVGMIPVPFFDLFAKVGVARIDAETRGLATNSDDNTTEFAYGGGAQWRWRNLAVRAEYEKFDTDVVGDLDLISLGATYTFNISPQ
jgi:opacity protein-like surface antigen